MKWMLSKLEMDATLNDYSVTLTDHWYYQNEFPQDMDSGETPRKHLQFFLLCHFHVPFSSWYPTKDLSKENDL